MGRVMNDDGKCDKKIWRHIEILKSIKKLLRNSKKKNFRNIKESPEQLWNINRLIWLRMLDNSLIDKDWFQKDVGNTTDGKCNQWGRFMIIESKRVLRKIWKIQLKFIESKMRKVVLENSTLPEHTEGKLL